MIVAVDRHPADRADRPFFGQRLWKRRVVSKLRDLDVLLRLSEEGASSHRPHGTKRQADSGQRNNPPSIHDPLSIITPSLPLVSLRSSA
jgi:hypothetical protein